jgi:hypothetical protein
MFADGGDGPVDEKAARSGNFRRRSTTGGRNVDDLLPIRHHAVHRPVDGVWKCWRFAALEAAG